MDVLVLIDKLDDLVHNAKGVPMTDQVRVDKEEIYDILDQMRATIPEEIKQARWIVKERQEMLAEAKREAERIVKEARERQAQLVSEQEVTKQAERAAEDIIEDARAREREIRLGAEDYADEILNTLEVNLSKFIAAVQRGRERLQGKDEPAEVSLARGEWLPAAPPDGRHLTQRAANAKIVGPRQKADLRRAGRTFVHAAGRRRQMLELDGLTRRYGDVVALDDLSFSVAPGRTLGFVGPNGAGQDHGDADRARRARAGRGHGALERGGRSTAPTRARFGYMPEERGLYPKMRVREQLVYFARLHALGAAGRRGRRRPLDRAARPRRRAPATASRRSRSATSSASSSASRSSTTRRCSCSTSRSPAWTRPAST